jgi:hypothetical protein
MARKIASAAPAALQLKTCKALMRDGGDHVPCGKQYLGDVCANKEYHLWKHRTGFCGQGLCEGTKAVNYRGQPLSTCKAIYNCPCTCHDELAKLFKLTGQERQVVDVSGYVPDFGGFVMPEALPIVDSFSSSDTSGPVIIQSPAPGRVPTRIAKPFGPTPSGRAARGELESWVEEFCDIWLVEQDVEHCTPTYLSEEIGRAKGITPPSVGAIDAVLKRWVHLGFATTGRKPTRFIEFTEEGIQFGLVGLKEKAKRAKKMQRLAQKRGALR